MNWAVRSASLLFLVVMLAGCSTAPPSAETRSGRSPRVRCLADPSRDVAEGTRPLFFLFCVEGP